MLYLTNVSTASVVIKCFISYYTNSGFTNTSFVAELNFRPCVINGVVIIMVLFYCTSLLSLVNQ